MKMKLFSNKEVRVRMPHGTEQMNLSDYMGHEVDLYFQRNKHDPRVVDVTVVSFDDGASFRVLGDIRDSKEFVVRDLDYTV